jgi:BlaI family transcriptional regulator, penicillinase repressor
MRRPHATLTVQELAIMKIVWRRGDSTVRDVYEALRESRHVAYTTVMTMMNILETKGYLKKDKQDRAYVYRPAKPERVVISGMVREFVNRVFDGAANPLLVHLVNDSPMPDKERRELLKLIRQSSSEVKL